MKKKRNFLQRFKWTIGAALFWMMQMGVALTAGKEELSSEFLPTALLAFIVYQALFGIRLDKKAQKDHTASQERKINGNSGIKQERWRAFFINLLCGALYLALARLVFGGGPKWLKREVPGLLWFLLFFYVTAYWIGSYPRRRREDNVKHVTELFLMLPFSLISFAPLFRTLPEKFVAVYTAATLSWEFAVFAILFRRQTKDRQKNCTVPTTATVVDNIKSMIHPSRQSNQVPVPTYQPVLDYYAGGEPMHITCDDGQPRPLPPGMVIKIYYNPNNPQEFRFDDGQKTFTDKFVLPILWGSCAAMLAVSICIGYFA